MILTRSICSLDIECTSVDPMTARIVEMGMWFLYPDGTRKGGSRRFNPGVPIPPESTEVHHITDADVKDCPPFSEYAPKVLQSLKGKDILGFNLWRLDLPLLDEECRRAGLKLDLTGVQVIDAFSIYRQKFPRKLENCVEEYCGKEAAEEFAKAAHGAGADSFWTANAFLGQIARHEDLAAMSLEELAAYSREGEDYVDLAGKLYRDKDGDVCWSFGKERDRKIRDTANYAAWVMRSNFPGSTIEKLTEELERLGL